jgi:hypothetical protein
MWIARKEDAWLITDANGKMYEMDLVDFKYKTVLDTCSG